MTPIYKTKSGESLSIIAGKMLNDKDRWPELAFLNGISHPYVIYPGQILELPEDKDKPLVVEVFGKRAEPAAATESAGFSLRPATVIGLIVAAAFLLS